MIRGEEGGLAGGVSRVVLGAAAPLSTQDVQREASCPDRGQRHQTPTMAVGSRQVPLHSPSSSPLGGGTGTGKPK